MADVIEFVWCCAWLQVWLAKHEDDGSLVMTPEGKEGLVGINCLTKIQVIFFLLFSFVSTADCCKRYCVVLESRNCAVVCACEVAMFFFEVYSLSQAQ